MYLNDNDVATFEEAMLDIRLPVEAKAIYAYFWANFKTNESFILPPLESICSELKMSVQRFKKYRKFLVSNNYLKIEQKKEKGRYSGALYTLIRRC